MGTALVHSHTLLMLVVLTAAGRVKGKGAGLMEEWNSLERKLTRMNRQLGRPQASLAFAFVEVSSYMVCVWGGELTPSSL